METDGIFTKKTHRPHTHRLTTHMLRGLQHTRRLTYTCSETHVHISSQAYMHKCSWAQACTFHKFTCLCTPGLCENTLIGCHVYTFMVLHTLQHIHHPPLPPCPSRCFPSGQCKLCAPWSNVTHAQQQQQQVQKPQKAVGDQGSCLPQLTSRPGHMGPYPALWTLLPSVLEDSEDRQGQAKLL